MAKLALYRKAMADGVSVDRVASVVFDHDHVSSDDLPFPFSLGRDRLSLDDLPPDPPVIDLSGTIRSASRAVRTKKRFRVGVALAVVAVAVAGYLGIRQANQDPAIVASGTFAFTKDGELRTEVDKGLMDAAMDSPSTFTMTFALPRGEWKAWEPPQTTAPIRYAMAASCPLDLDAAPGFEDKDKAGDVLCAGWGLVFRTTLEWSANISNETCGSYPECRGSSLIPNAAVQVLSEDANGGAALTWHPSVAISGDGNKVAYLDVLRRRWVVADLSTRQIRDITPELTAAQLANYSTPMFSSDGEYIAVRVTAQGETYFTDLGAGRTTPIRHACDSMLWVTGEGVSCHTNSAPPAFTFHPNGSQTAMSGPTVPGILPSPDGKLRADDYGGPIRVADAATGDVVATHEPKMPWGQTFTDLLGWVDNNHLLIHIAASKGVRYGYFSLDARTGAIEPLHLPANLNPDLAVFGSLV
ncbi:hypothetical protein ACIHFD_36220 [Nonomuraea sp. NPDC051941]|uniref:hypothetical protein n=1 Tax=Nonomuraea sp. NPDC051941 TaxID=3364373 RepID=UPI0037C6F209